MEFKPVPEEINGRRVLAAVRIPPLTGEYADQIVVILEPFDCAPAYVDIPARYTVYRAKHTENGWEPEYGTYDWTWPEALRELTRRVLDRPGHIWPHAAAKES